MTNTRSPSISNSSMKVTMLNVTNKSTSDKLEKIHAHKNHHIIALFYRDGCPPCDKMKPEWKHACEMFKQKYECKDKTAKECTVIANVNDKGIKYLDKVFHKIQGTPTILYISDNKVHEYNENDRTAPTFLKWFEETLKDEIVPNMINKSKTRSKSRSRRSRSSRSSSRSRKNINGGCWTTPSSKKGGKTNKKK